MDHTAQSPPRDLVHTLDRNGIVPDEPVPNNNGKYIRAARRNFEAA
ncbi:MAG TPA: hypothetical protein VNL74_10490 [Methylococcus sp.]|nr:hypothetical protein [Methylococcus sp.]